jgi:hypothetical protein
MLVKRGWTRPVGLVGAAIVVGLVVAGCAFGKTQPTPIYIIWTPAPTPSPSATPVSTTTPAPLPTLSDTPTPEPSVEPSPTAMPVATTAPYTTCTPSAADKSFWAEASAAVSWDVYCPVLPSGWGVAGGGYDGSADTVNMTFTGPDGATLAIDEGAFCTSDAATCSPHESVVGAAGFGDLTGSLDTLSGGGVAVYVDPGTTRGYALTGSGMSQESFVTFAATLVKVAKS